MSKEIFKMSVSNVRKLSSAPQLANLINTPNLRKYHVLKLSLLYVVRSIYMEILRI